ncbi:YcbK family protein [Profundibacter sp.]|uniref:YcbK family protein n=1 Tax=Profundibacter sp. TaxID=3101071 RepID=UPI003D09740A
MTDKTTSGTTKSLITRRGVLRAFAATTLVAAPTYANAAGFLRGAGDVRRLRMYSGRTGEHLDTIYWIEGKYIKDAIKEINYFMRDWREDAVKSMDIRNFDIITAAHNLLDTTEPYLLLSGYRTPKTNAMLRSRSRGVAKNSLHMKGQANDVRLKSRTVSQIYKAGRACGAGGVGKYSRSNFVHMDCGAVRTWGS